MMSLDDKLHLATQSWLKTTTPRMVKTEEEVVKAMRGGSLTWLGGVAGVTIAVLAIRAFWPDEESGRPHPAPIRPAVVMTQVEHGLPPSTGTPPSAAESGREITQKNEPATHIESVTRVEVEGTQDGFSAEYERILARAMQFEGSDPLRATTDYIGLGRICVGRSQYAHALAVLERARSTARAHGYAELLPQIESLVLLAQQGLNH